MVVTSRICNDGVMDMHIQDSIFIAFPWIIARISNARDCGRVSVQRWRNVQRHNDFVWNEV
jgi:hypothetical protein